MPVFVIASVWIKTTNKTTTTKLGHHFITASTKEEAIGVVVTDLMQDEEMDNYGLSLWSGHELTADDLIEETDDEYTEDDEAQDPTAEYDGEDDGVTEGDEDLGEAGGVPNEA
jgi:hypothetical protein